MLQLMSEGIEEFPLMFLVKNNCFIKDKVQYPKLTQKYASLFDASSVLV